MNFGTVYVNPQDENQLVMALFETSDPQWPITVIWLAEDYIDDGYGIDAVNLDYWREAE